MSDIDKMLFAHPAAVSRSIAVEGEDPATTRANLLELAIQRRALDRAALEEFSPFFWRAEVSNGRLDAYFTRMAQSTLRNYAADAESGVAFQNSHNTRELSLGRSLGGRFIGGQGNGIARVEADFYTVPGLALTSLSTDQLILGIRTGIISDVSVGFYGGRFVCSICGRDMLRDWDCWHIPGWEEEVEGDGQVRKVIAEATVEDARLAEVSAVYDGATPGAAILKAEQESENGRIRPETKRFIEQRYRINLPGKRVVVPGHSSEENLEMAQNRDNNSNGNNTPANAGEPAGAATGAENPEPAPAAEGERGVEPPAANPPAASTGTDSVEPLSAELTLRHAPLVRTLLSEAGLPTDGDLATRVRALVDAARDGATYREDLISQALAEGVRANGAEFAQDTYKEVLERSSIAVIKRMRDDWARAGKNNFPGGRATSDEATEPPSDAPDNRESVTVPSLAYQA